MFFTLTGYLLFLPFARSAWGERGPIRYGRYAANRALRILPLYYVVIAIGSGEPGPAGLRCR